MRTEELATSAMQLDKVELCNRCINVGRPKGYVEPPGGHAPPATLASAQIFAAQLAKAPTRVLLLKNMLTAQALLDEQERQDVSHPATS
jgi:splicing factor U2AF 65 kDa subunit